MAPPAPPTTLQVPPPGSVSILQPTRHLSVSVVVADDGDLSVAGVTVRAELQPVAGGPSQAVEHRIGRLAPRAARYVVLRGLHPKKGTRYELVVTASAASSDPVTDRIALCDASGGRCS